MSENLKQHSKKLPLLFIKTKPDIFHELKHVIMIRHCFLLMVVLTITTSSLRAQKDNLPLPDLKAIADLKVTSVKDQQSAGTCWDFATIALLEAELLRMGKPAYDLSELFITKEAYYEKGLRFIQFHGQTNFSEGGQAHDVTYLIKKRGIVPESVYTGLQYGRDFHIHQEMVAALQGMLTGINKNPNKELTPVWPVAYNAIIETYLGATPETFTYEGKEYTPRSFAASLGLNMDNYVELTSYNAFPFYTQVELPIPDNWMHERYYNLPIDELMQVMTHALKNGYTIAWDGDVSHKGFNHRGGLATLPDNPAPAMTNAEIDKWQKSDNKEKEAKKSDATPSKVIVDDELRQKTFNSRVTTDDHLMHLTGLFQDKEGTLFFKTKNSWNENSNTFGGYLYMSEPFVRLQTVAIMLHKDAIPKELRKKLGL